MQVLVPLIHQVYMQELTDYIYQACNLDNVPTLSNKIHFRHNVYIKHLH